MKWQDIIIWILFILSLLVVAWYFFGNSPTLEEAVLILIITILFVIATKVVKVETKLDLFERRFSKLEDSFIRLADDFRGVKKR